MYDSQGELEAALSFMVTGPPDGSPVSFDALSSWWRCFLDAARPFQTPIARALIGGRVADRVGYAFTAGYVSAIRRLVPTLGAEEMAALCVSEEGGAHPRAITAALVEDETKTDDRAFQLSGEKSFVTNADLAEIMVVAASAGRTPQGKNDIRVVLVGRDAPGVTIIPRDPLPFVPEVAHGRVRFDDVQVPREAVLPGDGYNTYVKPFRTIEDIHVFGGVLGYLSHVAVRYHWPRDAVEEMLSLIASVWSVAGANADSPAVHVALGGLFRRVLTFLDGCEAYWKETDEETARRWNRDRPLMNIAGEARLMRLEAAWRRLEERGV